MLAARRGLARASHFYSGPDIGIAGVPAPTQKARMTTPTAQQAQRPGPLHGIKVVEIASIVLGPLATQYLGDMGADVIKIEPPAGDLTR